MSQHNISSSGQEILAPKSKNHKLFWLLRTKKPRYDFHTWTVWSEIVQACRKGQSTTAHAIAKNTGLSKHTALSAVNKLIRDNLAVRRDRRIHAVKPSGECDWFARRKTKTKSWTNGIAYFLVEFHPELSLLQNILLGRLQSLPQLHHQSYAGLATMLGVKNRSDIRRALEGGEYKRRSRKKQTDGTWVIDKSGDMVSRQIKGLLQHEYLDAVKHRDDGYLHISLNPFVCPADDVSQYHEYSGALNGSLKGVVGAMKHEGFNDNLIDQILRILAGRSQCDGPGLADSGGTSFTPLGPGRVRLRIGWERGIRAFGGCEGDCKRFQCT